MPRFSPRPLGLCLALGTLVPVTAAPLWAQSAPPRVVSLSGDSLQLGAGERVMLPFASVSRIIVEDDEVARASFQNGNAVLEGVGRGTTTIEIYQSDGTPRLLTVRVGASAAPPLVPINPVAPTPAIPTITATPPGVTVEVLSPPPPAMVAVAPPFITLDPAITPAASPLAVTLSAAPVVGTGQAQFTVGFSNPGAAPVAGTVVRFALDERVSYVTGSATNGGVYDAARREVVWDLGALTPGASGQATLRVEPVEGGRALKFDSVATIEDGQKGPVTSASLTYSTAVTPLLTVFALPDRFLAGQNSATMVDVRGNEYQTAVDRLSQIGIVQGYPNGQFRPLKPTERAEYAVMTLRGLNLRDLRDVTQLKFVLGRASTVNLNISDAAGKVVANLILNTTLEAGEHTKVWNGRMDNGKFAPPGRYSYQCTAKDARGESTTLMSYLTIVSPSPLRATGMPTFTDIQATDWYAGYLALGEQQGLLLGFPDKTFRPKQSISRIEATAIVVRALGLSDVAREWADRNVGFADYEDIPAWGRGVANAASMIAKTSSGQPIIRGTSDNKFEPGKDLRRDQAALIVQRLIDRETTRRVSVSGAITPGALVSINSKPIEADGQGRFGFSFDLNTALPTTVAVVDARQR